MRSPLPFAPLVVLLLCYVPQVSVLSAEPLTGDATPLTDDPLAGHSFHGEVFNEGPRQAAYLMPGLGRINFSATTNSEMAQRFIHQGIEQLHGFWYYEAERSFRQAAVLDPDCAICYWGMAMANGGNRPRAREFIAQAMNRKQTASPREQRYIEAYEKFCRDEDDKGKKIEKKAQALAYTRALEDIVVDFPEDIEAKAFLALQLWQNERADLPIVSHVAIDSVLQDVFDANPMHPAHHYRIHLWDKPKAERALASAALCGQSLPAIAHMWHMPGHIYSKLHRYQDAVWQQEASARVDHAHMMRDRVLPDQIHNFAHNNEWLIRNLLKIGRVSDALSLAKNMLELPRHPKYNTLKKGSTKLGRERLLLTLTTYRLWPELIELADTMYLEPTTDPQAQLERARYLGLAYALSNQPEQALQMLSPLEMELQEVAESLEKLRPAAKSASPQGKKAAVTPPEPSNLDTTEADSPLVVAPCDDSPASEAESALTKQDAKKARANRERRAKEMADNIKQLEESHNQLKQAVATIKAGQAVASEDWNAALEFWKQADLKDNLLKAEWLHANGKTEEALAAVDAEIKKNPNEVPSHAVKTWLLYLHHGSEGAKAAFELTRTLACTADLDTSLLTRLLPLAAELGEEAHWPAAYEPAADTGERPSLESLGPFRWHPYRAPDFLVQNKAEQELRLKQLVGKPTVIVFYLGFGCLHCVEQLHAFSPRAAQYRESGIDIIAISTESLGTLSAALSTYSKPLDIPLHADPDLAAFKAYRCFDDFEQQPLHGTFLLDPDGRILWQDISYEPFMDADFVLAESHRLLRLAGFGEGLSTPRLEKLTTLGK